MLAQSVWFSAENGPVSRRFDLSRSKSLRTLETTARSIDSARDAPGFFKTVLSTTTPSLVLNVVITYRERDIGMKVRGRTLVSLRFISIPVTREVRYSKPFRLCKEMYEVREFQLVLCADVFGFIVDYAVRELELAVEEEKARGGLDYLQYEPPIISEMRVPRSRPVDWHTGWHTGTSYYLDASAL